jgi:integration host factor subunit beta
MLAPAITNALTIDVEDYFQVSAFAPYIRRDEWDSRECRVERNVDRILAMLSANDTKATFFTLGWVAERYPQLVAKDADFAVKTLLDAMTDALSAGQRIEIRGFGSFALNSRPPRIGRNPKSGDTVMVPEKRVPHFKPGKELRERVDAMVGQPIKDD